MGRHNKARKLRKAMDGSGGSKRSMGGSSKWTSRPKKMKGAHKAGMLSAVFVFGLILFGLIYFLSGAHMIGNEPPDMIERSSEQTPGKFYPKNDPDYIPQVGKPDAGNWSEGDKATPIKTKADGFIDGIRGTP